MNKLPKNFLIIILLFVFIFSPRVINAKVYINELLPNPSGDEAKDEWVELYNSDSSDINIDGYTLKDASGHSLTISDGYTSTGNTIIAGSGWLVIYRNGSVFSLNNSGDETVTLISSPSAQLEDTFFYNGSEEDKSWGRLPDGGNMADYMLSLTPGSANQPSPTPVLTKAPTEAPTSTPDPTKTSTPTPISTPTPKPTKTSTPKPKISSSPQVLGDTSSEDSSSIEEIRLALASPSATPLVESSKITSVPFYSFLIIAGGVIFLGVSAYLFFSHYKTGYNGSNGSEDQDQEE